MNNGDAQLWRMRNIVWEFCVRRRPCSLTKWFKHGPMAENVESDGAVRTCSLSLAHTSQGCSLRRFLWPHDMCNRAEEAAKTVALRPNFISTFTTDRPFKTIMIGNPKIVDATAQDDRTVVLTPHAVGETNIIFLDERNVRVTSINVLVEEGAASRVKIHNKKLVTSFTVYRCSENRCQYVEEVTAKEPAELPRGHLNQNQSVNENINSTTIDQTPKQ